MCKQGTISHHSRAARSSPAAKSHALAAATGAKSGLEAVSAQGRQAHGAGPAASRLLGTSAYSARRPGVGAHVLAAHWCGAALGWGCLLAAAQQPSPRPSPPAGVAAAAGCQAL